MFNINKNETADDASLGRSLVWKNKQIGKTTSHLHVDFFKGKVCLEDGREPGGNIEFFPLHRMRGSKDRIATLECLDVRYLSGIHALHMQWHGVAWP